MNSAWLEDHALRYVSQWEASEARVAALLERKIHERCEATGESPESALAMIPDLVMRLVEQNYVNDTRFAEGTIERQRRRGASTSKIRAKLLSKGISESTMDALLAHEESDTDLQAAWGVARRRRLGPYCKDPSTREESHERHLGVLSRAGFEYETALLVIDARSTPESESESD